MTSRATPHPVAYLANADSGDIRVLRLDREDGCACSLRNRPRRRRHGTIMPIRTTTGARIAQMLDKAPFVSGRCAERMARQAVMGAESP